MKFLRNWSIRLGLVSGAVASVWLGMTSDSLALPQAQIIQKLQQVPVFTVANENGAPLVASGENNSRVAGVFISQQDAEEFISRLKQDNPELGEQVQVVALSLGRVYQMDQENEGQTEGLDFTYVPMEDEVESAMSLLQAQGEQVQNFPGVPLFIARGGEDEGYLMVERDGQQIIPLFFEKQQLQRMVDQFKQDQPQQAQSVQIDVVTLESMLQTLEEKDDEQLKQVVLVPSQESLQFLQSVSEQQLQQQQQSN
ncbi:Tic22 family protein [Dactylococcopsis salina]|uniref:Tic22-like family n=1 Tax=Dactylococcopsis salina (strain PCC 8305) TaxID=13035 RepID=K9YZD6_DACS8|nr:Tic22 family protein [Dactylococcopsis salina]AFZ51493.1 Tic22-like family [Dactylococcopsis salina PCC 8305]